MKNELNTYFQDQFRTIAYYLQEKIGESMALPVKRVAVIGAGISGVSATAHLKASGLQVTLFERTGTSGGVWYLLNAVF
jgi:heterodisulfide reductase subunit A-like polyferredoxin